MTTSENGMRFLANLEGIRKSVYDDFNGKYIAFGKKPIGNPTIGIGHLIIQKELYPYYPQALTTKQVYELFKKDLLRYEKAINSHVKVMINQNQFDALVSFCFNIGINGFIGSTALRLLNKQDYYGCSNALLMWKNPGLLIRRSKEKKLFLS